MADINSGSTGKGRSASEPLLAGHLASRAAGAGPTGGAFGESSQELEGFIRTATKGKSAVSELLGLLSGDGKTKVSNFTGAIKSLNTELKRAVDLLNQAKDGAGNLPAGLGGGGGGGNGGDVRFGSPAAAAEDHARDTGGGGDGGGGTAPRENGGSWRSTAAAGALAFGGAAITGGVFAAGAALRRQADPAAFFDTLARQRAMYQGGTPQSWSDQYSNLFRGAGASIGGAENFMSMDAAMQAGGLLRGTQGYSNVTRGAAAAAFAMPGADRGQLAGTATSLQHGGVAMGLRQRGITSFEDDFPTQMRKIMRAAMGGRQPTEEMMALIRPGTIYYDNLMALLGDDPAMVAQVIEFNRADAKGRSAGVDVTTRAGATRVGLGDESIEGAQAFAAAEKTATTTTDRLEHLNDAFTDMAGTSENVNEWLAKLSPGIQNMLTEIGKFTTYLQQATGTSGLGGAGNLVASYFGARAGTGVVRRGWDWLRNRRGTGGGGGGGGGAAARTAGRGALRRFGGPAAMAYTAAESTSWMQESDNELLQAIGAAIDRTAPGLGGINQIRGWLGMHNPEPAGGLDGFFGDVHGADHDGEGVSRRGFGGVKPHVAAAGNFLAKKFGPFPGGIGGVGKRSNKSDHPAGLALDFMTNNNQALGDRLVNYLQKNAKHFGVKYIIWKQRINSGSGWRKMEDRGSPTANHMDHPHVSFHASPGQGTDFEGEGFGSDTGGTERTAASAISRLSGGIGGRSELEIFNSFFGGGARASSGTAASGSETGDADPSFGSFRGGQGQLSDTELMQVLQAAGFSGASLITAFAVARAESGGNSRAFNGNRDTGDKSYGLFQINMLDSMGAQRRKAWGLSSNEDLYDPVTNARIAHEMSRGGTKWTDWSVHPHSKARGAKGSGYEQYLDEARAAFSGVGAEPRGGLDAGVGSSSTAEVGYVPSAAPPPPQRLGGSSGPVNITVKVERASYSEAEKFTEWVVDLLERREGLAKIGGR